MYTLVFFGVALVCPLGFVAFTWKTWNNFSPNGSDRGVLLASLWYPFNVVLISVWYYFDITWNMDKYVLLRHRMYKLASLWRMGSITFTWQAWNNLPC